jgi:hypothetical protein
LPSRNRATTRTARLAEYLIPGSVRLIRLKEANGVKLMGDFVELDSVRIFGVRYLGSSTVSVIRR